MPSYNCTRNDSVFPAKSAKLVMATNVVYFPKFVGVTMVSISQIRCGFPIRLHRTVRSQVASQT
jgi:hypothetical protein